MDLLMIFGFLTLPIGLVIAAVAVFRLRGLRWKIAAALPWIGVAGYFAFVLMPDWAKDPTSHNLFPFELGVNFWLTLPYIVGLWWAYRATRSNAAGAGALRGS